jgi:hypothetical protein
MGDTQLQSQLPPGPAGSTGAAPDANGALQYHDASGKVLGPAVEPADSNQEPTQTTSAAKDPWANAVPITQGSTARLATVGDMVGEPTHRLDKTGKIVPIASAGAASADPWANAVPIGQQAAPSFAHRAFDAVQGASNAVQDVNADVATGFAKGAADTALGATKLMNKVLRSDYGPLAIPRMIPGVKQKLDKWIPEMGPVDDYLKAVTGDPSATLEAHGVAQNVGKVGETLAEFMVGEGELKALGWTDKVAEISKAGKVIEKYKGLPRIISSAMRAGVVGGAQDLVKTGGEDPMGSLEAGGKFAAFTGVVEGGTDKILKPAAQKLFKTINAPKDLDAAEAALQKTREDSPSAISEASKDVLPGGRGAEGSQLAQQVQNDLNTAVAKKSTDYEKARTDVTQQIEAARQNGTDIRVGGAGSALNQQAIKFATAPSGLPEGFEDVFKNVNTATDSNIAPLIAKFADETAQPMTWNEAETVRQQIGEAVRNTPYGDPTKWQWISMRSAMDETMEQAATAAGHPEISKSMELLRSNYADATNALEKNSVIKALRTKDYDSVADVLMRGGSTESNYETLRKLLISGGEDGKSTLADVERSLFLRLVDKSTTVTADGTRQVNPNTLANQFYSLPESLRATMWGRGETFDDIKDVIDNFKTQVESDKAAVAAGKKTVQDANRSIFSPNNPITRFLGGHAAATPFMGMAAYKVYHGDYSGAVEDLVYGLAAGAGQHAAGEFFGNAKVQSRTLSLLEFLSHATSKTAARVSGGGVDVSDAGAAAIRASRRGTTSDEAALNAAAKTGLSANTKITATARPAAPPATGMAGKGGGINTQGAVASQTKMTPDAMAFELERQISSETGRLRTVTANAKEKAQLAQQIETWKQQLDEIRKKQAGQTTKAAPGIPVASSGGEEPWKEKESWLRYQLSDGRKIEVHPEDVSELKNRDPRAIAV